MKNFLCIENLKSISNESLFEIIQSSSEMEGYPIKNILESDEKTLWLSTEELPQEITINIKKELFKEMPKKISALGIYCWHAYPTNPKLIEIQISKNKGMSFISLGNFDLCLKPGKQLLQFDYETNPALKKENINDIIIKLIIKETFGDKRTYINNIYLYDNINLCQKKLMTNMETIKEEESNSMIYLRESREKTVINKNLKGMNNIEEENKNKINSGESQSLLSDSDLSEKYNNNINNKVINKNDELNKIQINSNNNNNDRYSNENENDLLMEMNKQINLMLEKDEMKDIQQENELSSKEKSLNINDFNNEEEENEKINKKNSNMEINENNSLNDSINEESLNLLIEEFENYKRIQEKRMINYENKIRNLENQFKEMSYLSNKMNETINTILESQILQQNDNHEYILNSMKNIIQYKINNVFNNFNHYSNYNSPYNNLGNNYYNNNDQQHYNLTERVSIHKNERGIKKIPLITRNMNYEYNRTERNNYNTINGNNINYKYNDPLYEKEFPIYNKYKKANIKNNKKDNISTNSIKNYSNKERQKNNDNE